MIVCDPVPIAVGVYVTEQLAELPPAGDSEQVAELMVPVPLEAKPTVPVGVVFVPMSVSVTVAVHVVLPLTGTVLGVQLTVVLVVRFALTASEVVPELPRWLPAAPYVAVIVCAPDPLGV